MSSYTAVYAAYAAASDEYVDAALHYNEAMASATALREAYYAAVAEELKALCDKETKRRRVSEAEAACRAAEDAPELEEGEIIEV